MFVAGSGPRVSDCGASDQAPALFAVIRWIAGSTVAMLP
jgi:hypothetical protein